MNTILSRLDNLARPFHNPGVKRSVNPFTSLLTRACDRLYSEPVALCDALRANPADTLHLISRWPEHFGEVQPFADAEMRRQRISDLLDSARTYLVHERKMQADMRAQGELPLSPQVS